jgi:hypothetical protein
MVREGIICRSSSFSKAAFTPPCHPSSQHSFGSKLLLRPPIHSVYYSEHYHLLRNTRSWSNNVSHLIKPCHYGELRDLSCTCSLNSLLRHRVAHHYNTSDSHTPYPHISTMAPSSPIHSFAKRDNMGFELPPTIIVLLIMIAAGFVVCMGFAVHNAFGFGDNSNQPKPMTVEQMEYMAEVKVRNLEALQREGRHWQGSSKRRMGDSEVVYD